MEKIHEINVQWPWLKILLIVALFIGAALGTIGGLQKKMAEVGANGESAHVDVAMAEARVVGIKGYEVLEEKGGETEKVVGGGTEAGDKSQEAQPGSKVEPAPQELATPVNTGPLNSGRKVVALTFDDGPSATTTSRLLDILATKQVKATFFVLGGMAQKAPEIVKREAMDGHEIESHTMSHLDLTTLSGDVVQGEVVSVDAVLQGIIGWPAKFVRPPYGAINDTVRANVGKPLILWSVDPQDWKYRDGATVRANVVSRAFDGAIILMHDIYGTTVDAVAGIIDDLWAAGYEFLTVSEMAAERGYGLQNGYSYGRF